MHSEDSKIYSISISFSVHLRIFQFFISKCAKLNWIKRICGSLARPRTVRRRRFGDGGRKYIMRNIWVFLKYFEGETTKDVCFISVFVVILMASDQCSFPTVRILEELSATVTTCVKKYGLWRLFLLTWGVNEFTQKLSLDGIYCLHVGMIAFHS